MSSSTGKYVFDQLAGVVARAVVEPSRDIEGLRGRNSSFEVHEVGRQVQRLSPDGDAARFESVLALSFVEGLREAFNG